MQIRFIYRQMQSNMKISKLHKENFLLRLKVVERIIQWIWNLKNRKIVISWYNFVTRKIKLQIFDVTTHFAYENRFDLNLLLDSIKIVKLLFMFKEIFIFQEVKHRWSETKVE